MIHVSIIIIFVNDDGEWWIVGASHAHSRAIDAAQSTNKYHRTRVLMDMATRHQTVVVANTSLFGKR